MRKTMTMVLGLGLVAGLAAAGAVGCGGDSGSQGGGAGGTGAGTTGGGGGGGAAPRPDAPPGVQAGEHHAALMKDVVALLEPKPEAAAALPKAKALKEKYIPLFVEVGKRREPLDADGKRKFGTDLYKGMTACQADTTRAVELTNVYQGSMAGKPPEAEELSEVLSELMILSQYSDFDLLKKQKPDEAKRLGIQ